MGKRRLFLYYSLVKSKLQTSQKIMDEMVHLKNLKIGMFVQITHFLMDAKGNRTALSRNNERS